MSYYNMTSIKSFTQLMRFASTTVPFFGQLMLVCVFIVTFLALKSFETGKAFSAASFITLIAATMMFVLGLIEIDWIYLTAVMTAGSVFYFYFNKD